MELIYTEYGKLVVPTFENMVDLLDTVKILENNEREMVSMREHFVIFRGDDIVDSTHDVGQAEEIFNSTQSGRLPSQSVAMYKLVKEKRVKR